MRRRWLIVAVPATIVALPLVAVMWVMAVLVPTTLTARTARPAAGAGTAVGAPPGVDGTVWAAVRAASAGAPCRVPGWLLAGVGQIESGLADGRTVSAAGDVTPPIIGPALDGVDFALYRDSDGGQWDGDLTYDRAVGAWQVISGLWNVTYHADGNGDGIESPHNVFDSAAAAVKHLCAGRTDLSVEAEARAALFRYNPSTSYVEAVWAAALGFREWADRPQAGGGVLFAAADIPVDVGTRYGRATILDGTYFAPPGTTRPEWLATVGSALHVRFGVDVSQCRPIWLAEQISVGVTSDHAWCGGMDVGWLFGDDDGELVRQTIAGFEDPLCRPGAPIRVILWGPGDDPSGGHNDHMHLSACPDSTADDWLRLVAAVGPPDPAWWPAAQGGQPGWR